MAGEPEDDPDDGGGKGPCCWARAGAANAEREQVRKRTKIEVRLQWNDERAKFATLIILVESIP